MLRRALCALTLLFAAASLAACGGDEAAKPAAGSPGDPLIAKQVEETAGGRSNEVQSRPADQPSYDRLLARQSSKAGSRFSPCNLVTRSQARSILGTGVQAPVEAPQGPTCIYRGGEDGAFVTVAVQERGFDALEGDMRRPEALRVGGRRAVCGSHGASTLYVALGRGHVLSVAAPCPAARRFAAIAVARLAG